MDSGGVFLGSSQVNVAVAAGARDRPSNAWSETKGSQEATSARSISTDPSPKEIQVVPPDSALGRVNAPLAATQTEGFDSKSSKNSSAVRLSALAEQRQQSLRNEKAETQQDQVQIQALSKIDKDVRSHEAAHAAAGGALAGAPSYNLTRGPDGRLYATGGEVSIDTRAVSDDPEATIEKAQTVINAALAPVNPSAQDLRIAAEAQSLLVQAQAELTVKLREAEATINAEEESEVATEASEEVEPSAAVQARESIEEQLQRSREQRAQFAEQLQELSQRLNKVQQQLIDSGAVETIDFQGNFLDVQV